MSEPVNALDSARFDGLVSVVELPPQGMITLRGDFSSSTFQIAAKTVGGGTMPAPRRAEINGRRGLLWMSPDEALVLCPYGEVSQSLGTLARLLGETHALAVDVSDARACFELHGSEIRDVLAKLTPADMSRTGLPLGELRRTRLAQVPAAFWLESETRAQVICFRSVAGYVFDLFKTAAAPDSDVGFFAEG